MFGAPIFAFTCALLFSADHVAAKPYLYTSPRAHFNTFHGRASATPPCPHRAYVAIGDVFTAGVNSGDQLPDCADVNGPMCTPAECARNKGSYAYQFYKSNPTFPFTFPACADANTSSIMVNQINNSTTGAGSWAPQVDLLTISIGANDAGLFSTAVQACMMDATAANCNASLTAASSTIACTLPSNLQNVFSTLQSRVMANSTVLVMGYPLMFSNNTSAECASSTMGSVTQEIRTAMNENVAALNTALQTAASAAGFMYIDNAANFVGHSVCDSESWLQFSAMNGTSQSYLHPTQDGQNAIRAAFKSAVCGY